VISGLAVDPAIDGLVAELAGHVRALLRDVLCGHLDADLRGVADEILAEAVRDAVRRADAERAAELEARAQLRARAEAQAAAEQDGDYEPGFVRFAEP
jgi:predicted RecB family endonuclease